MKTSNSAIQTFKACRRLYELKYKYGLEPIQPAAALERGINYHAGVEAVLKDWAGITHEGSDIEDPKIRAMVFAFRTHVVPKLVSMGLRPADVEKWFTYDLGEHEIVGRIDGRLSDGSIIEHKTTSGSIDGAYFQRLEMDEQIPTYMLAFKTQKVIYTVCQTPTIRQKKDESEDEFFARCVKWYDVDTDTKIQVVEITKSKEELERFAIEQAKMVYEMANCDLWYRNPSHCMKWGRLCEFAPVCMNYDPNVEYIQFKRRDAHEEAGEA